MSEFLETHKDTLVLWIGAICTLGFYSILYRENRIYRFFEHLFLGLAMGYGVANVWTDTLQPKWWEPLVHRGHWWLIFVMIIGLFYYFVYSPRYNWLARLVIGFFLGVTSGRAFQAFVNDYWPQIPTSFKPVIPHGPVTTPDGQTLPALTWSDALNNILFMVILLCVMSYFFFSFEQKHPVLKRSAQLGRWLMMFTFGAIFGSTIMGRLALMIDRMDFLVNDFGPQIGGPWVMFLVLIGLAGLVLYLSKRAAERGEDTGAI
ncbi:MAG: hypothetical protein RMJ43_01315 [Chloroherpetonaceae bacterium]|nr:hypothetical protein [Chthonomonadaceae bacterium]MDW8206447.1 hypothetical protein [Chloroherpetonaceae bacterium]